MEYALSLKGKLLAYWQVLSGLASVVIVVIDLLNKGNAIAGAVLTSTAVLSLFAGVALLKGDPTGIGLSWLAQLIQVPALYLKGFYFQVFLLLSLNMGKHMASGNIFLKWHAGSGAMFRTGEIPFLFAGVNMVALFFCLLLPLGAFKKES
jgi:hypothetical protein